MRASLAPASAQKQLCAGPGALRALRFRRRQPVSEHGGAHWLHREHAEQHAGCGIGVVERDRAAFVLRPQPVCERGLGRRDRLVEERLRNLGKLGASAKAASTSPPSQARSLTADTKASIRSVTIASNTAALFGTSRYSVLVET